MRGGGSVYREKQPSTWFVQKFNCVFFVLYFLLLVSSQISCLWSLQTSDTPGHWLLSGIVISCLLARCWSQCVIFYLSLDSWPRDVISCLLIIAWSCYVTSRLEYHHCHLRWDILNWSDNCCRLRWPVSLWGRSSLRAQECRVQPSQRLRWLVRWAKLQ